MSHDHADGRQEQWERTLAAGALVGDLSPAGLSRFGDVSHDVALAALRWADDRGWTEGSTLDPVVADDLIGRLDASARQWIHAAAAQHLLILGSEHVDEALEHTRASGSTVPPELLQLLCSSARVALAAGRYETAASLLGAAADLDAGGEDDPLGRARLLFDLARSLDGSGHLEDAARIWLDVIRLALTAGEHDLVVDAALARWSRCAFRHRRRRATRSPGSPAPRSPSRSRSERWP